MRSKPILALGSLLAAVAAFPSAAEANLAIIRDFKAQAQVLPLKALSAGYRRFGAVDLNDLLSRMQGLDVRVAGKIAHAQPMGPFNGERDGAQWSQGSVTLSAKAWPKVRAQAKPMLALHEALGALQIEDDNFGCSGSIWVLTDPKVRATMTREEIATYESYAERGCYVARGGGSTGVTGGGDDYNVNIRMNGMHKALDEMQRAQSNEQRQAIFSSINGAFYSGYAINRRGKLFDPETFSLNVIKLQKRPIVERIRVFEDTEMTMPVPQNAKHGWTYDARSNTITVHGRYRKGKYGVGFAVLSSSEY